MASAKMVFLLLWSKFERLMVSVPMVFFLNRGNVKNLMFSAHMVLLLLWNECTVKQLMAVLMVFMLLLRIC